MHTAFVWKFSFYLVRVEPKWQWACERCQVRYCECIKLVMDNRQRVVRQPGVWVRGQQFSTLENQLITKCYTRHRVGSCEHGKEPSGSIKGGAFTD